MGVDKYLLILIIDRGQFCFLSFRELKIQPWHVFRPHAWTLQVHLYIYIDVHVPDTSLISLELAAGDIPGKSHEAQASRV